jgi:hypothetical protein
MKNPPTGGFFIAAKFTHQEVVGVWCTKKRRSSNRRASGNEEPADRRVFYCRKITNQEVVRVWCGNAAKFLNQEVAEVWRTRNRRSSNRRVSSNEEPADRQVFYCRKILQPGSCRGVAYKEAKVE